MNRTWKQTLSLATKAENKLSALMGDLSSMAKEYFDGDISCEYIPGDGFVICWEDTGFRGAPHVMPITMFFFLAKKNGEVTKKDFEIHSI